MTGVFFFCFSQIAEGFFFVLIFKKKKKNNLQKHLKDICFSFYHILYCQNKQLFAIWQTLFDGYISRDNKENTLIAKSTTFILSYCNDLTRQRKPTINAAPKVMPPTL